MSLYIEDNTVLKKYHDPSLSTVMLDLYVEPYNDLKIEAWADSIFGSNEKAKRHFLSRLGPQAYVTLLVHKDTGNVEIASAIG